jgi:hypothetical protein
VWPRDNCDEKAQQLQLKTPKRPLARPRPPQPNNNPNNEPPTTTNSGTKKSDINIKLNSDGKHGRPTDVLWLLRSHGAVGSHED